ncbi:RimK/LysX family protein [Vibrio sp. ZSDZ34]|jgi:hypothetical protein|uniref:RimK/LysX family protein n=1 Tax=Vibrio gelatinilyticus TaxID=2893468 RepID=A0A9X1WBM7_9VIBR|nr:ATP-dependent zinc protease [Vibrio gelatinilyticus]MCJ2377917.1 RimK/LysX family protein [Vibrio gelatinilyticus]
MYKRLAPVVAIGLLAGCSTTNHEQLQQATIDAINTSEARLENRLTNLDLQLSNQSDYIDSLESEVIALTQQLDSIQLSQNNEPLSDDKDTDEIKTTSTTPKLLTPSKPSSLVLLGSVEMVELDILQASYDARVDTGAATSSLNAIDIQEFERNGSDWVRFHLVDDKHKDRKQQWIEAPIVRYVKIRQQNSEKSERRAVIELWIRVGKIHEKAQFTLADRSQMNHPILLGREFIKDIALVDVSQQYILSTNN